MRGENFLRKILKKELALLRKEQPSCSVRVLAKKLDVDPGLIAGLFTGKKQNISRRTVQRIASELQLDETIFKKLLSLFPEEKD